MVTKRILPSQDSDQRYPVVEYNKMRKTSESSESHVEYKNECNALDNLLKWATDHGAVVDNIGFIEHADDHDHFIRGARAKYSIEAGQIIGYLPECLILSETTAKNSHIGKAVMEYMDQHPEDVKALGGGKDPYAAGLVLLAAFIAYSKRNSSSSFWTPYLSSLPACFGLPIEWPETCIDSYLKNTNIMYIVRERKRLLRDAVDLIRNACKQSEVPWIENSTDHEVEISYDEMLWAYGVIASRAFPKSLPSSLLPSDDIDDLKITFSKDTDKVSELCLYPVLDMLNHERGRKIEWNSVIKDGISFITPEGIEKGTTLWNNYGSKGNEVN